MTDSKKVAFAWNDKNTAVAVAAYAASKNDNSTAALAKIAESIGAKSGAAVRMKLVTEKVYVKVTNAKDGKPTKVKPTKVSIVRTIEKMLGLTLDELDSLEKGSVIALNKLTEAVANLGTDEAIIAAYNAILDREAAVEALAAEVAAAVEA